MNENILQSFKSESAPCIKLLSLKRKSRLWIIETSQKGIPSRFMLTSTWNISILPPTCWSFHIGLNENANSFFATRCCFWSVKAHKHKSHRSASRKWGVWKNESLNESFGSRWTNKVKKKKAYYKKMKVFFDLACMSTCCWGLPKPKYEPFITHNRGTLTDYIKYI